MRFLKGYLSGALLIFFTSLQAQHFDSLLIKLATDYSQEKMYLHFDRPIYNPGETIWFKAYLFTENNPSAKSKTLYTELLDARGNIIQRKSSPIFLSSAASSFDVPLTINSGVVYVRAYTTWMLNFDPSFLYTQAIPLTNINGKKTNITSPDSSSFIPARQMPVFYLQFFPEGGDLVQGVQSRVAFKATNATGIPINVSGNIATVRGKKITSFTSAHDGMGTFLLQPESNEQYKALWKDPAGKEHETILPAIKPSGVVLELNNRKNEIEFKVKRTGGASSPYLFVYVIAQTGLQQIYKAKANLSKSLVISSVIPVTGFPAGILQLTLFNPDNQPIAERLVFINKANDSFITNVNTTLTDMGKRKKNVIQIEMPDTLLCNLSVAVTDADLTATPTNDNIFSRVLLTDDIPGYINNPAYYFSSNEDSISNHLDLIMMTNGWRRFKWKDMLAGKWPTIRYPPDNYLSIEGMVSGLKEKQLLNKELNVIVTLKNNNKQFVNTKVQKDGSFIIPEFLFYDTARFYYQFNNDKNKSLTSRATFNIKNNLFNNTLSLRPNNELLKKMKNCTGNLLRKNCEKLRF